MKKFISGLMMGTIAVLMFNVSINKDDLTVNDGKEERVDRIASVLGV